MGVLKGMLPVLKGVLPVCTCNKKKHTLHAYVEGICEYHRDGLPGSQKSTKCSPNPLLR